MKTSPIKIILAANFIFLILSVVCISNAYFGGVDGLSVSEEKTNKIKATIQNETNIEKLRSFALISLEAQNGAYEAVDSAVEVSSTAIKFFSIMFAFNTIFLLSYLLKNKKKSNKLINRTENTSC
ncbi:hypothetical protein [Desulfuromonas sp. AOP6]|uniref:hypothetical protein n=1 Tax=Desulfuromonas sp. AOP6 TaxID=1566351 RepID=UPI0012852E8C|nr:hypothetical protein [Desulfuromonas sp. AOP6]BCA80946.1 hypothetical protein AOP6_2733 [Desulfuromonas sp. AOP6]